MDVSYSVSGLSKDFAGVPAVEDATFDVFTGSVHGVIGKNGAGKSVLMNMVAGLMSPSGGRLRIGEEDVDTKRWSSRLARHHGVALITQEPPSLPYLTVEDYLFLGDRSSIKLGVLNTKKMRHKVAEIDERLSLKVRPADRMVELPIEVQQLLAFGKAVYLDDARVVLLDEITASLSATRRDALLTALRELAPGRSFTLISHRISEVMTACDRVTVMRDGNSVETIDVPYASAQQLAAAIVGGVDTHAAAEAEKASPGQEVLRVSGFRADHAFEDVNLTIRQHEVLGLAGLDGSGRDELLEALAGLRRCDGRVRIAGCDVSLRSVRRAAKGGIAYLPKKREELATIHGMSVMDNLTLPVIARYTRFGLIREPLVRRVVRTAVGEMQVKTRSIGTDIDTLSGGNRQKVMIGRLRLMKPRVYLLNEPTRGVDIATKPELLRVVRQELTEHSAVVMTSESEEELVDTCDRILVFYKGRIVRELRRGEPDFTVNVIYRTGQGVDVS